VRRRMCEGRREVRSVRRQGGLRVERPEDPEKFAAKKVTVTGTLDAKTKTIQVDSIAAREVMAAKRGLPPIPPSGIGWLYRFARATLARDPRFQVSLRYSKIPARVAGFRAGLARHRSVVLREWTLRASKRILRKLAMHCCASSIWSSV